MTAEQRAAWDAASAGWEASERQFERGAAPLTARLIELAGVRAGMAVLDVATGQGEPALSAARLVGPTGRVVGVDVSPVMLDVARRRGAAVDNVDFVEGDLNALGQPAGSFDAVLSRLGLMFALDHVATFRALARVLVPGGVLAAATWGSPAQHAVSRGPAALVKLLDPPPTSPGEPGPFSMSDPDELMAELAAAGFVDVSVVEQVAPFRFDSVDEYIAFNQANLPATLLDLVKARFGSVDADAAWQPVVDAVRDHTGPDGALSLPCTALLMRAVKPRAVT